MVKMGKLNKNCALATQRGLYQFLMLTYPLKLFFCVPALFKNTH